MGILEHHAHRAAQVGLLYLLDIDAVIGYLALGDIVKSVDKVGDRGLARARRADKGNLLPRHRIERDVLQNGLLAVVAEADVVEAHVAPPLGIGYRAVAVRMLPRPDSRPLAALGQAAVGCFFSVDEGNVAVVRLGRGVDYLKYTLSARKRHDDIVKLLRYLCYRLEELLGVGEERQQSADGDDKERALRQSDDKHRAEHSDRGVGEVRDIAHYRHQHARKSVSVGRGVAQPAVYHAEIGIRSLLVAEYLDHLLALDEFLDIAVDVADAFLLLTEVSCAA